MPQASAELDQPHFSEGSAMDVGSPSRNSSADHRKTQPLGAPAVSACAHASAHASALAPASATDSAARPLPKDADRAGDRQRQGRDVKDGGAEDANHKATIEEKDENKEEDKEVRFHQQDMFLVAVAEGDTQEVRRLVHAGFDPNTANADGLTALHEACL